MCDAFAAAGREVLLLHPNHRQNLPGEIREFYGLQNPVTTIKVPCLCLNFSLPVWLKTPTLEALRNTLVTDLVGMTTALSIVKRLIGMMRRGELGPSDVIYGRSAYFALFLAKLILRLTGRNNKVAIELHHPPMGRLGLLEACSRRLDRVFVINSFLVNDYRNRGFDNVEIVPDGVDVSVFNQLRGSLTKRAWRERLKLPTDRKIVIYAGHLYPYKGVDDLIAVAKEHSDAQFVIVGGFPEDVARSRKLVDALGLTNVMFTGFVTPAKVPEYLIAADVCVYTLRPDAPIKDFTSPIKLFEYLASGNPVIAADVPGVRDVIVDGQSGVIYRPGDIADLGRALQGVLSDDAFGASLACGGAQVAAQYSWTRRAEKILATLHG
jgi:glycosyltransferase involved in cell wall biosynthesis